MGQTIERITQLLDPGSFLPYQPEIQGGWINGWGTVSGRKISVSAGNTEPTKTSPHTTIEKQISFLEEVLKDPSPFVLLADCFQPLSTSLGKTPVPPNSAILQAAERSVGKMYYLQAQLSGKVPQVGVLLGKLGAALSFPLALCDTVVTVNGGAVCIGRPDAVKLMVGEETEFERLGGAMMHCTVSGLGDVYVESEAEALRWVRHYLSYFPSPAGGTPAAANDGPGRANDSGNSGSDFWPQFTVPDPARPFDMRPVVQAVADKDSVCEIKALYAKEVITALARVDGRPVGIIANNSRYRGGILFPETCRKMIEFISLCNSFGIPLVFLADTPGFMVGEAVERAGLVKAGAQLFAAIARTEVPRLCIVLRRAYTAGLYAMSGPGFNPDGFLAAPSASIAVFGKKALERFANDKDITDVGRNAILEIMAQLENPSLLKELGLVQAIIEPQEIRPQIAAFLKQHTK